MQQATDYSTKVFGMRSNQPSAASRLTGSLVGEAEIAAQELLSRCARLVSFAAGTAAMRLSVMSLPATQAGMV